MLELETVDIVLVEDSDEDAEMTLRAFDKGHVVNTVLRLRDGVEALDYLFGKSGSRSGGGSRPRLILLDIKMPRVDGIEVLRRLKAADATRSIPVVMLTSSAEERDIVESYRLGVNSYLVKPVSSPAFTDVITQAGFYWAVLNRQPS
jgi:CheY-like chemotaxis protein